MRQLGRNNMLNRMKKCDVVHMKQRQVDDAEEYLKDTNKHLVRMCSAGLGPSSFGWENFVKHFTCFSLFFHCHAYIRCLILVQHTRAAFLFSFSVQIMSSQALGFVYTSKCVLFYLRSRWNSHIPLYWYNSWTHATALIIPKYYRTRLLNIGSQLLLVPKIAKR